MGHAKPQPPQLSGSLARSEHLRSPAWVKPLLEQQSPILPSEAAQSWKGETGSVQKELPHWPWMQIVPRAQLGAQSSLGAPGRHSATWWSPRPQIPEGQLTPQSPQLSGS